MDTTGAPLDVSGRASVSGQMSAAGYAAGFSTRAQIFAGWNGGAGWAPTP
jgi:hypothetical protein